MPGLASSAVSGHMEPSHQASRDVRGLHPSRWTNNNNRLVVFVVGLCFVKARGFFTRFYRLNFCCCCGLVFFKGSSFLHACVSIRNRLLCFVTGLYFLKARVSYTLVFLYNRLVVFVIGLCFLKARVSYTLVLLYNRFDFCFYYRLVFLKGSSFLHACVSIQYACIILLQACVS